MSNPINLDECLKVLDEQLSEKDKLFIKNSESIGGLHSTLGRWIRNNWGFWSDSPLKDYFKSLGLHHPDDMSGIILKAYYAHLKNETYDLSGDIKYYQDYWEYQRQKQREDAKS